MVIVSTFVTQGAQEGKETHIINILLSAHARWRLLPLKTLHILEGRLEVLDTLDNGFLVLVIVEVGVTGDDSVERAGDGHATARLGTSAEVLAHGDSLCVEGQ